jgi:hypothetical protein
VDAADEPTTELDLRIGGLLVRVHGRERPASTGSCDGDWLDASAQLAGPGCEVHAAGTFLRSDDLERFLAQCRRIAATLSGEARLAPLEPNLAVTMRCSPLGHLAVEIELSPDPTAQSHRLRQQLDQTHLPPLMRQVEAILARFPARGRA